MSTKLVKRFTKNKNCFAGCQKINNIAVGIQHNKPEISINMKLNSLTLFFPFFLFFSFSFKSYSQKEPMKFGKIDMKNLEMTRYEADTNASAVILFDFGKTLFQYNESLGRFQIHFERHVRVKIFDKEAYDWADWIIPLRMSGTSMEKLTELKGLTFNMEDGKAEKTKLSGKNVYEEKVNRYLTRTKFAMPNVKEGSIIDIKYSITSDLLYHIRDWYFQYEIPVKYSEYTVEIPEFYLFKKIVTGYVPMFVYDQETHHDKVVLQNKSRTGGRGFSQVNTNYSTSEVDFDKEYYHFITKDVPAFIEEQPMTSKENYISKVEFELSMIKPGYGTLSDYSTSWEAITKTLLDNSYFGSKINGGGSFLKDEVNRITAEYPDEKSRMEAAYSFITDRMEWNGYQSKYVNTTLREAYSDKTGNCADINLMLVLMLRKLGINADPVILKTRDEGFIRENYPTLFGINYVIASAVIDSTRILMDATSDFLPCGVLPVRDLNKKGRLISETSPGWVDLTPSASYKFTSMNTITMDESGNFTGSIQRSYKGYAAYDIRIKLSNYNNNDDYISEVEDKNEGLKINNYKIENVDDLDKPVKEKFEVTISDQSEDAGDMIYFSPLFYQAITKNPFKLKKRVYPVEYPYKKDLTLMLNFTVPKGYRVEEVPENVAYTLPENGGKFIYKVTKMGQMLQVITKLVISKELFVPEDYETLKEFYNLIIAKHAEQIILVKE